MYCRLCRCVLCENDNEVQQICLRCIIDNDVERENWFKFRTGKINIKELLTTRIEVCNNTCERCNSKISKLDKEYVCTNCGAHYGYGFANEYIDYNKYRNKFGKRSVYRRKYHVMNLLQNNSTTDEMKLFMKYFKQIEQIQDKLLNKKRKHLKFSFIFTKIYELMGLDDKAKMCTPIKSSSTKKYYDELWEQIFNQMV